MSRCATRAGSSSSRPRRATNRGAQLASPAPGQGRHRPSADRRARAGRLGKLLIGGGVVPSLTRSSTRSARQPNVNACAVLAPRVDGLRPGCVRSFRPRRRPRRQRRTQGQTPAPRRQASRTPNMASPVEAALVAGRHGGKPFAMKRFYKTPAVDAGDGGFRVLLDGKPMRTPAKSVLVVPTERACPRRSPRNGATCRRRRRSRSRTCR